MTPASLQAARERALHALLAARNARGHWTGHLSSSALSTATAVCALAAVCRAEPPGESRAALRAGLGWLAGHQNADGGWGDTERSFSNLSTTLLAWAAFGAGGDAEEWAAPVAAAEAWLRGNAGSLEPERLAGALAARYGKDRTFSIPILTLCAIAGRLGPTEHAWRLVPALPFELAALPASWFGALRLPVVSYALPALIAIGQVRHHFRPTRNPLLRPLRAAARGPTLRTLERIQPANGGFLEATPLTAFVTMSLAAMGLARHPVAERGVRFLLASVRPDGSWPIDTNLSTWLTTLAVQALGGSAECGGALAAADAPAVRAWLLGQQGDRVHPYTRAAPGGWAWTDLPGGVPDADDTAGALLALRRLGPPDGAVRRAAAAGVRWLLDLQNRDGGVPTFCKGWGTLPFDRSSPDITAHALRAWAEWGPELPPALERRVRRAIRRGIAFLAANRREDGAWIPLWFGHQEAARGENAVYGTARVLLALRGLTTPEAEPLAEGAQAWLVAHQNGDGGWAGAGASSVEETGLALEALAVQAVPGPAAREALRRGAAWLAARVEAGPWPPAPEPIGFYFAQLWYSEALYPAIFAAAALRALATKRPSGNREPEGPPR
ncbi:MAG: prenyltransferase/squalene oxidase repeat-containing protein [Chthoniobacteraceae bacterium]|nr:prenyltransferase/squalene oxidase repeat-containing protein [Chthoniobacteraceae bacterium]